MSPKPLGMGKRPGTDVDANNLKNIFRKLGFIVEYYKDKTARQMLRVSVNLFSLFRF